MRYSLNSYAIRQGSKSGTSLGISGDDVPRAETLWCDDSFADGKRLGKAPWHPDFRHLNSHISVFKMMPILNSRVIVSLV